MRSQWDRSRNRSIAACRQLRDRLEPVYAPIRSRFEVDTRALAALRIALGLILLVDLAHRVAYLETFYTDAGVYPLATYGTTYSRFTGLSIHAASGELWFQGVLFLVAGLFAVALILGYRTRLVALVSLLLLFSLHARNPAILNGGDRLLRVLLLVALVTPLGERWSIDALRRGSARTAVVGFGTAALLVQPIAVFTSNAIQKHAGDTWYSGDALVIAFANDVMTVHLGNHLLDYPFLLEAATWGWVVLLAGSPLFLLATTGRLRAAVALAYVGAFAGMLLTMSVGLFPLVLIAAVLPYLTAPFWDAVARVLPSRPADRLPSAAALGPLGRPPVERRLLETLRERGHASIASDLVVGARSVLTAAGVLLLVWILLFTAVDVADADAPGPIDNDHFHEQRWGLYAPDPSSSYSWFVVEAELSDGTTADAFEGGDVLRDRPPDASLEYDTFRHRKFMETVARSGREDTSDVVAEDYADWACERADAKHDGTVERVTVHRIVQPSPVEGGYEEPSERTVIERAC